MIDIGLVGCGRVSSIHLDAISRLQDFRLVAVCDLSREKVQETADKYQVKAYTDYSEFLSDTTIRIVDICTPSGMHPSMGMMAAKAGKDVILEKPMGVTSFTEAVKLVEFCKTAKRNLFVIKQNRCNPLIQKLYEMIRKGRFGKIISASAILRWKRTQDYYQQDAWRGTKQLDGGVLMNQASHHVDLLRWIVGDVRTVFAKRRTFLRRIESEDTAIALLEFKNGALGTIEATTCASPSDIEASLTVLGEKGSVKIGGTSVNKIDFWKFEDSLPGEEEEMRKLDEHPDTVYGNGHIVFFKNIADVLLNNAPPINDGEDGLKTFKLLLAVYASADQGKEIDMNQFNPE
jgi:UDP-N-acetyl-2-amino-2-deoxyglucuronate dehydrogenase